MNKISIIICSVNNNLLQRVSENIKETIGVGYEIVAIDNSQNKYGICEAYNLGAENSKYDNLCFIHEDIIFKKSGWGEIVNSILSDKTIGLLGVAGNTVKTKHPSPWWLKDKYKRANIYHVNNKQETRLFHNPQNEELSDVVIVDGIFMSCRKEVWYVNKFDTTNFPEFHSYDMDFSIQIFQSHRVCVTFAIDIAHYSTGNYNQQWIDSVLTFSKKWKKQLPVSIEKLSKKEKAQNENEALTIFTTILLVSSKSNVLILKYLFKKILLKLFDRINFIFINRFIRKLIVKNN